MQPSYDEDDFKMMAPPKMRSLSQNSSRSQRSDKSMKSSKSNKSHRRPQPLSGSTCDLLKDKKLLDHVQRDAVISHARAEEEAKFGGKIDSYLQ